MENEQTVETQKKSKKLKILDKLTTNRDAEGNYIPAWQNALTQIISTVFPIFILIPVIDLFIPKTVAMLLLSLTILLPIYMFIYADRVHNKYYFRVMRESSWGMFYVFIIYYYMFINIVRFSTYITKGEYKLPFTDEASFNFLTNLFFHTLIVTLLLTILFWIIGTAKYYLYRKEKDIEQYTGREDFSLIKVVGYVLAILTVLVIMVELWDAFVFIIRAIYYSFSSVFNV